MHLLTLGQFSTIFNHPSRFQSIFNRLPNEISSCFCNTKHTAIFKWECHCATCLRKKLIFAILLFTLKWSLKSAWGRIFLSLVLGSFPHTRERARENFNLILHKLPFIMENFVSLFSPINFYLSRFLKRFNLKALKESEKTMKMLECYSNFLYTHPIRLTFRANGCQKKKNG